MKLNIILLVSILAFSLTCFSQSSEWTKEDRNNIYDDYLNALTKYKNITKDQKESVALCCLDEATKKYTKKDYQAKIEVEINRIQQAAISLCGKNIGVDLSETKKNEEEYTKSQVNKSSYIKDDFNGAWTFEAGVYNFYPDGEFKYVSPSHNNEARGKWYLDGKTLILEDTKTFLKWGSAKYQVVSVSSDEIVLLRGSVLCNLKKNK
jgi:hypothetical protein